MCFLFFSIPKVSNKLNRVVHQQDAAMDKANTATANRTPVKNEEKGVNGKSAPFQPKVSECSYHQSFLMSNDRTINEIRGSVATIQARALMFLMILIALIVLISVTEFE